MRVEHNGHWAELVTKTITWGQRNKIRSAADKDFWQDFAPAIVTITVSAWSYPTDPTDPESWESVDPEFGDKVFDEALTLWKDRKDEGTADPTPEQSESS